MEHVAETGATWPVSHNAAMLTPIKNTKGETVGSIFMDSTGVTWSVKDDDTKKTRSAKKANAESAMAEPELGWLCTEGTYVCTTKRQRNCAQLMR